jgi:hypothetical protein
MKIHGRNLPSSLIIFGSTLAGYLLAYLYELGYLNYYGISENFVNIAPAQILYGSLAALAAAFVWDTLFSILENRNSTYDKSQVRDRFRGEMLNIFYVFVCALFFVFIISLANTSFFLFFITLLFFVLVYLVILIQVLIKYLRLKRWDTSLAAFYKDIDKRANDPKNKNKPLDMDRVYFITVILIACFAAYAYGHVSALPTSESKVKSTSQAHVLKQHTYTVVDSDNKYLQVVIRRYNDTLLIKSYDEKNKKFIEGFKTERVEDKSFTNKILDFK